MCAEHERREWADREKSRGEGGFFPRQPSWLSRAGANARTMATMPTPAEILDRIRELEAELEVHVHEKQQQWHYRIDRRRVRFERAVREQHRALKEHVLRYLRRSRMATLLSAPVIYSVFVPLVLADLWISGYQAVCFPIYGIPKVRRADYFVIESSTRAPSEDFMLAIGCLPTMVTLGATSAI